MSDLAEQIDALLALNAKGAVSHHVPYMAVELLTRASKALRTPPDGTNTLASKASETGVVKATHRHKKRGTEYVLIGIGKMQAEKWLDQIDPALPTGFSFPGPALAPVDMRDVAIYRSVDDGSLWVRPREEFEDGRFDALTSLGKR